MGLIKTCQRSVLRKGISFPIRRELMNKGGKTIRETPSLAKQLLVVRNLAKGPKATPPLLKQDKEEWNLMRTLSFGLTIIVCILVFEIN